MDPLPRWLIAIPTLTVFSLVIPIISYLFYKIVKSHRKTDDHQPIYYSAIMFMAFNWLHAVNFAAVHAYNLGIYIVKGFVVKPFARFGPWSLISGFLLLFQNYLFLVAMFTRLRGLFQPTPVPLSKRTVFLYVFALTLLPFCCLCLPLGASLGLGKAEYRRDHHFAEIVYRLLIGTPILMYFVLLISLLALFILKLKQIQRNKTLNAFIHRQVGL